MKKQSTLTKIISILVFFFIWQVICMLNQSHQFFNPVFLPAPTDVMQTGKTYWENGQLLLNVKASMLRLFQGYMIGIGLGICVGCIMGKSRWIFNIIEPVLSILGSIPTYALCPLMIIWFGIGEKSKVILIAFATFIPMVSNTTQGIRSVDDKMIYCALSLGANKWQIIKNIYLRSAASYILFGMKTCLSNTFATLVVAEMMGSSEGLGFIIVNSRNWFLVSDMFLAIVLIIILYLSIKALLTCLEKKICYWLYLNENNI